MVSVGQTSLGVRKFGPNLGQEVRCGALKQEESKNRVAGVGLRCSER